MSRTELERVYKQDQHSISFKLQTDTDSTFYLDGPSVSDLDAHTSGLFVTHLHKDHCPQETGSHEVDYPVYMNQDTEILLRHLHVSIEDFKDIRYLVPNTKVEIEGLGQLTPISVSHSSVDALAFFIELKSGDTILYTGDIRDGNRTSRAVASVKKLVGSEGVTLFIGDATNVGKQMLSLSEHEERMKSALLFAKREKVPASIYIKPGDYGSIAYWFEQGILDSCDVYVTESVMRVLGPQGLNWSNFLKSRYGYQIQTLFDPKDLNPKHESVLLYDQYFDDSFRKSIAHVLINSSRNEELPYKTDSLIALFPVGLSGHSQDAYFSLLEAANPRYLTYSHAPKTNKNDFKRHNEEQLVLKKHGVTFTF